jgi:hypothetical protein
MRGIDLLLGREAIDPRRILVIGAVAGGGDPAAVVAALDARVAGVVPFNFGGPQPETRYPLPPEAETVFDYMGRGSWESTRNLRLSGRDGFLPWVIDAAAAPRPLIYAHEFRWDRERDPVWKRLQQIFALYEVPDHLDFVYGAGEVTGRPPEATHCNNVGPPHRAMIHPAFQRWFGIPIPDPEYSQRLPAEELMCLTPPRGTGLPPGEAPSPPAVPSTADPKVAGAAAGSPGGSPAPRVAIHQLFAEIGAARADTARTALASLSLPERKQRLRDEWAKLLGEIDPRESPVAQAHHVESAGELVVERVGLEVEPGIRVPLLLLLPSGSAAVRRVVVAVCQEGKAALLRERSREIAALVAGGAAVCLPDVRGTGETSPGPSRERQSVATSLSATEWMLGQTLLGARLRDLRAVLRKI